ncbi:hypothetical protein AgCh_001763 [Apium graveolens]
MILYNFRHIIRKLTAQQQNYAFNIAQPVSETHAFRHHPNVVSESNCEALKAALLHQDRVAVKNKGKILSNSRSSQAIGDTCNFYEKAYLLLERLWFRLMKTTYYLILGLVMLYLRSRSNQLPQQSFTLP